MKMVLDVQVRNQDFMWGGGGGVLTRPKWTSDQLAAYLRKKQISQRSSKTSRCHLFLVASLVLSDAALDCHQYSQVLELAQSLQFY